MTASWLLPSFDITQPVELAAGVIAGLGPLWVAVTSALHPRRRWDTVDRSKGAWIGAGLIGLASPLIGFAATIAYAAGPHRALRRAAQLD